MKNKSALFLLGFTVAVGSAWAVDTVTKTPGDQNVAPEVQAPANSDAVNPAVPANDKAVSPLQLKAQRDAEIAEINEKLQSKQLALKERTKLEDRMKKLQELNRAQLLNQDTTLGE